MVVVALLYVNNLLNLIGPEDPNNPNNGVEDQIYDEKDFAEIDGIKDANSLKAVSYTHLELTLTGYDLEVGITTSIEARVEQEGSIILNARLLCDILRLSLIHI